ncbi:MAG TPA: HPr family phosphocarrier protein [Candidatus Limnocylindria bacterium]|nr:HPr family phosphocarrier protein [Candidatus Limnocylindria bacterium]
MHRAVVTVANPSGLHARPAAAFVKAAAAFSSEIRVANLTRDPERRASAKSILGVMQLGVSRGHELAIEAEGEDAECAVQELVALVEAGLGEQPAS